MTNDPNEETDEVIEGYIQEYRLDEDLPARLKKQALFLITSIRKLRRLKFEERRKAEEAEAKVSRWLAESRVFHPSEHEGYNRLLEHVGSSLQGVRARIEEKFGGTD